jgi:uncharacterized caspase-like protein
MMLLLRGIAAIVLNLCLSMTVCAEKRVALVIGNSEYALGPLKNPVNDADDLAEALKRLHFEVVQRKDLTIRAFDDAIDDFVERATEADVAMFFFSGHGLQIDKRGFLVPVDFEIGSESAALRQLLAIQEVVSRIERAAKVSVVVLDACRDSPLQEQMRRIWTQKNKAVIPAKGLPPVSVVGSNTLIVYATVAGETASDGPGSRNSPFTAALLKNIETANVDVEIMFKRVTADVLENTAGKQQPERQSRLQSELILLRDTTEQQVWDQIKDSRDPAVIETYLNKYPEGSFAPVARATIRQIEQQRLFEEDLKEESKRRAEAERKEADVRRLEEQLKVRERELLEENKRIEEARGKPAEKKTPVPAADPQTEHELQRAKEEARLAKEAAAAAEKRRQSAEKAATEARSKAEKITAERETPAKTRPNANAYSSRVWPRGSVRDGERVSTMTDYGRLICVGGNTKTGKPRECHWN